MTVYNPTLKGDTKLLPQPIIHALASSMAELVSCAILTPAEVIKQNAQMVDSASSPKTSATMQTLQRFRSNPLGLWRGYTALAGRNLPFTALQFPMFERLKVFIRDYRDKREIRTGTLLESGLITATSAGIAGSISAVITTPIDVVKTRIMLAAAENAANDNSDPKGKSIGKALKSGGDGLDAVGHTMKKKIAKKSSLQIGREVVTESGYRGLWRGGALRGVWTMLGSGLYLGVYESGRIYLANRRGAKIEEDDLL
jgi:solute carrier family 25 S-adenosylmethionine transporter 26